MHAEVHFCPVVQPSDEGAGAPRRPRAPPSWDALGLANEPAATSLHGGGPRLAVHETSPCTPPTSVPTACLRSPHAVGAGVQRRAALAVPAPARGAGRWAVEHILECGGGYAPAGLPFRPARAAAAARSAATRCCCTAGRAASTPATRCTPARACWPRAGTCSAQLRDHGDTHHLNPEMFHLPHRRGGGAIARWRGAGRRPLALSGFSLGGNFALRVAARGRRDRAGPRHRGCARPSIRPRSSMRSSARPGSITTTSCVEVAWFTQAQAPVYPEQVHLSDAELRHDDAHLTRVMVERHTDFGSLDNNYLNGYPSPATSWRGACRRPSSPPPTIRSFRSRIFTASPRARHRADIAPLAAIAASSAISCAAGPRTTSPRSWRRPCRAAECRPRTSTRGRP